MDQPMISIFDPIVMRGDGCFDAVRSYDGFMVGLDEHIARLGRSCAALDIEPPDASAVRSWAISVAADRGDGVVRMLVSPTGDVYVVSTPVPTFPESYELLPMAAPWHPAGATWELSRAKTLSYAPNMAATRSAVSEGYHDALLVTADDVVLEAPTAGVFWVLDGVIETATNDLGILDSVTMAIALELAAENGMSASPGTYTLDRLDAATEVAIVSTSREIVPVTKVGQRRYTPGPVTASLSRGYVDRISARVG